MKKMLGRWIGGWMLTAWVAFGSLAGAPSPVATTEPATEEPTKTEAAEPTTGRVLFDRVCDSPLVRAFALGIAKERGELTVRTLSDGRTLPEQDAGSPQIIALTAAQLKELPEGYEFAPFAYQALALYVHETNTVESISQEQARDIFSGHLTHWESLNRTPYEFHLFTLKEKAAGMPRARKILMGDAALSPISFQVGTSREIEILVAGTLNGIGFGLWEPNVIEHVRMVPVDRVEATEEAIRAGVWPWRWTLGIRFRTDDPDADYWRGAAERFAAELASEEAEETVQLAGWVSLAEKEE